jgi:hypothetical protein
VDAAWGAQLIQPAQVVQLGVKKESLANTPLLTTLTYLSTGEKRISQLESITLKVALLH